MKDPEHAEQLRARAQWAGAAAAARHRIHPAVAAPPSPAAPSNWDQAGPEPAASSVIPPASRFTSGICTRIPP